MSTPAAQPPSSWGRTFGVAVLVTVILAGMLCAFALPMINLGPRDVPIAVAGSKSAADKLVAELDRAQPGAFDVTRVAGPKQARERVLDHKAYGAVLTGESGTSVVIATAASPSVANLLRNLAASLQQSLPQVEDVRPLPADDPGGAGLAAGALPLVLGGWVAAVVMMAGVRGVSRRLVGGLTFAVVAGLSLSALEKWGFGTVDGDYLAFSAAAALSMAAVTWMILGLRATLGNLGLGIGAILVIFLGNPLSGLNSAPEMLPSGWGTLGQLLPPGAGGTLLRSVAYFAGKGSDGAVLVLAGWLVIGLGMYLFGELWRGRGGSTGQTGNDPAAQASERASVRARPAT